MTGFALSHLPSPALLGLLPDWILNWVTPIWILSLGFLGGLLLLLALWAVVWILAVIPGFNKFFGRVAREVPIVIREGVLLPLMVVVGVMATVAIFGAFASRHPGEILASLQRLPATGATTLEFTVAPTARDALGDTDLAREETLSVSFRKSEIKRLEFESDQNVSIFTEPFEFTKAGRTRFDVSPSDVTLWNRNEQSVDPFPEDQVEQFYVVNHSRNPAELEMTVFTAPQHPEVMAVPITAISIASLFVLYFLQSVFFPRISAVALSTFKSEVAQPMFAIMIAGGVFVLAMFIWIPYHTLGEDIKVLKDTGLTLIMILGIIQAVFAAGWSVAEEIDGRTALTVLSKPIGRRSFIIGKFLGIAWTVGLMFIVLGLAFLVMVAYKPIYDATESSRTDLTWQICFLEMVRTVPGLLLAFMETLVLAALSVAISTRLPSLANLVICAAIYVLGHLTPLLVQSSLEQLEFVKFFAQLIATIFPNLDHFNIQAAVASGVAVPHVYLGVSLVYCLIFSLIALLLALLLFEDRDLA